MKVFVFVATIQLFRASRNVITRFCNAITILFNAITRPCNVRPTCFTAFFPIFYPHANEVRLALDEFSNFTKSFCASRASLTPQTANHVD